MIGNRVHERQAAMGKSVRFLLGENIQTTGKIISQYAVE